jgi:hypothetical protein
MDEWIEVPSLVCPYKIFQERKRGAKSFVFRFRILATRGISLWAVARWSDSVLMMCVFETPVVGTATSLSRHVKQENKDIQGFMNGLFCYGM